MAAPKFILPEGWTSTEFAAYGTVIDRPQPGGGSVTVDFELRAYAGGTSPVRSNTRIGSKSYKGRGWQQELVNDAVSWLESVMNN